MKDRYDWLEKIVQEIKPINILEIGVHQGRSAERILREARKYNREINYYGFDLFEAMTDDINEKEFGKSSLCDFQSVSKKLRQITRNVNLYKGNTHDTLPLFFFHNRYLVNKIDFIFIDGGHSLETIDNDFEHCMLFLNRKKGVILFDDYYKDDINKGCFCLINRLNFVNLYNIQILEPTDVINKNLKINFVRISYK